MKIVCPLIIILGCIITIQEGISVMLFIHSIFRTMESSSLGKAMFLGIPSAEIEGVNFRSVDLKNQREE